MVNEFRRVGERRSSRTEPANGKTCPVDPADPSVPAAANLPSYLITH